MLRLHVLQAEYGDCLILEYGSAAARHYTLIDGGPRDIYKDHLKPVLQAIHDAGGTLDVVVLSHVDEDHVMGLLDLFTDLQWQRTRAQPETIAIGELWHNSFSQTLGKELETSLSRVMRVAGPARGLMVASDKTSRSIAQGDQLAEKAELLRIERNARFTPAGLACPEEAPQAIPLDNLRLHIVGPTEKQLKMLKKDWLKWLKKQEKRLRAAERTEVERAAIAADASVPNLSSIMVLAAADGKTLLLPGDGRHDHLVEGLRQANLLDPQGHLHVDVLKLPHHGSSRNASPDFFRTITADRYVISANGMFDNPDATTLQWVVEAAREQGRAIEIVCTNEPPSILELPQKYDPAQYGYRLTVLPKGEHALVLELSSSEGSEALGNAP
jgi:beta-lactamase superfamily II metal-dependent hydrolase